MTLQRRYSLPYCTITLQGLISESSSNGNLQDHFPVMSVLLNAECYFAHCDQSISGGREFLASLVRSVTGYAQELLSQLPHPDAHHRQPGGVEIHHLKESNLHQLSLVAAAEDNLLTDKMLIELTTIQLFDLVEAVDQFLDDRYTLPELVPEIRSLPRRYRRSDLNLAKRAMPVAIGLSGLGLATAAVIFAPIPEVRRTTENTTPTIVPTTQPTPAVPKDLPIPNISPPSSSPEQ